jgi:hypothetical protein
MNMTQPLVVARFVVLQEFTQRRVTVSETRTVNETVRERANRIATEITVQIDKRNPTRFRDEDDFIDYRRELREEIYSDIWTHDYF